MCKKIGMIHLPGVNDKAWAKYLAKLPIVEPLKEMVHINNRW